MTLSDPRRITDELLSAYIDDEVTEQERAIVDAAIAADEEIAWRLNSLRQTVTFLRDLPELALPRSFALTLDQVRSASSDEQLVVAGVMERVPAAPAQRQGAPTPQPEEGFWENIAEAWRRFWQGGNPMLRNAAAVSFALMLIVASGGDLINRAVTQPAGMMATAPEAAPAAAPASESSANMAASSAVSEDTSATSAEAVALAPTAEATTAKATDTQALEVQAAAATEAPAPESARIMQSQAEPAADASAADASGNDAAGNRVASDEAESDTTSDTASESAERMAVESAAVEEEAAPEAPVAAAAAAAPAEESAVESAEGEAAAEASSAAASAPEGAPAAEAPAEDQAADAAMAAAAAAPMPITGGEPPLIANPAPGMGGGGGERPQSGGGSMGGGGPEGDLPPNTSSDGALVPQQAYEFDIDSGAEPTTLPLEEAVVTESVEAASAPLTESESESAGESAGAVADVAVTPAVEAVEAEATTASQIEPTATPEAIALVAPGAITSSEVVANVKLDEAVTPTDAGANLPVVWIAQASMLLLTFVFASLWWRSRKAH